MTYKEAKEALEYLISGDCTDNQMDYVEEIQLAISCIDAQIPKKPIGRYTSYKCPVCGRRVKSGKGSSSRVADHFCQRCGQVLDWSDDE